MNVGQVSETPAGERNTESVVPTALPRLELPTWKHRFELIKRPIPEAPARPNQNCSKKFKNKIESEL